MVSWKLESIKSRTLDPRARPRSVGSNFILKSKYQTTRQKWGSASNPFSLISRKKSEEEPDFIRRGRFLNGFENVQSPLYEDGVSSLATLQGIGQSERSDAAK